MDEAKTKSSVSGNNGKGTAQKSFFRELLPYLIIIAAVLVIRTFFLINASIPTESMENTILPKSRVMGLKCTYWFHEPERGDIVVFHAPDEPEILYVKRLIGLPGDTVEIIDGVTYVNGEELQEDYLKEEMYDEDYGPYEVPEDCYFMMGDNRNESLDARFWENTYVTDDAIVGKVYFTYWPSIRWLDGTAHYED
ncbi:MAG: signal peptidase I [Clostridiales bacterium]|nr:signal peptidase I [Clostridiales bacterium]